MYSKLNLLEKFLQSVLDISEDYSNFDSAETSEVLYKIIAMAQLLDHVFMDKKYEVSNESL